MRSRLAIGLLALLVCACGPGASGAVGTVHISGGPYPGNLAEGQPASIIVSAGGRQVTRAEIKSGTTTRIPLTPGAYVITAAYGNAGCTSVNVLVGSGLWSPFQVICNIR